MRVEVTEKGLIRLEEVFVPIQFQSPAGEFISICMRDGGFEIKTSVGTIRVVGDELTHLDPVLKGERPRVVCICGSTRFADLHAIKRWELEREGKIGLMINYLPDYYAKEQGWTGHHHFGEQAGLKEHLDELHFRKIDMADEVFVINKDGYIGESTRAEIEYAESTGKPVYYLETGHDLVEL